GDTGTVAAGRRSVFRRWRTWAPLVGIAAIAFVAGGTAEYLTAPEYTETEEYAAAQADFAERETSLDLRERDLDEFEDDVEAIDERSAELDQRSAGLDTREAELDTRSGELDTRSSDLDARDAAVTATEAQFEAGTIPGDGIYLVGTDIQPGEYRGNPAGGDCYWARLSGTSGDLSDVRANGIPEGPTVVTISSSDVAFETSSCGEWHRIP
ncbi:MAG: hypothetical protein ACRDVZ_05130, partial [Jiangellaceae bacterium]